MKWLSPPLIPEKMLTDPDINGSEFRFYVFIASNLYESGFYDKPNNYTAKIFNVRRLQIIVWTNKLVEKGYLIRKYDGNKIYLTIPAMDAPIPHVKKPQKYGKRLDLQDIKAALTLYAQKYRTDLKFADFKCTLKKDNFGQYMLYDDVIEQFMMSKNALVAWKLLHQNQHLPQVAQYLNIFQTERKIEQTQRNLQDLGATLGRF